MWQVNVSTNQNHTRPSHATTTGVRSTTQTCYGTFDAMPQYKHNQDTSVMAPEHGTACVARRVCACRCRSRTDSTNVTRTNNKPTSDDDPGGGAPPPPPTPPSSSPPPLAVCVMGGRRLFVVRFVFLHCIAAVVRTHRFITPSVNARKCTFVSTTKVIGFRCRVRIVTPVKAWRTNITTRHDTTRTNERTNERTQTRANERASARTHPSTFERTIYQPTIYQPTNQPTSQPAN